MMARPGNRFHTRVVFSEVVIRENFNYNSLETAVQHNARYLASVIVLPISIVANILRFLISDYFSVSLVFYSRS